MKNISKEDIRSLSKIERLNLVNSCTGYKSANLIGTISNEGKYNLAIFSSITHLGSDPAMLGFILRPTTVPRHTYQNFKRQNYCSVNAIPESIIKSAHQTSAKYPKNVSEFEAVNIEKEIKENINVPFVKNSPLQLLCKFQNEYEIAENNTLLIVASIEQIFVEEAMLTEDYWIRLDKGNVVSINGLDGYSSNRLIDRFSYARPNQIPQSKK